MTTATRRLDREACYRAVKLAGPALRRRLLHRGPHDRHLLPPVVPGAHARRSHNVTFHPSAAAAQAAGFRACKRCLPDATPGSPEWDVAADVAGRAMRLIADGVVDREGVEGLAARVGYTPRHLSRLLTAELGAGPLALARARRAQTARVLIETTDLQFADDRVRGRLRERPAVQRHDPRGLRALADRAPRTSRRRAPLDGHGDHAAGRPDAVRRPRRCSRSSPCAPCRASRRPARAGTPARSRSRTAPARSGSTSATTTSRGRRRSCWRPSPSTTCATPPPASSASAGCSTPTATRSPSTRCSPRPGAGAARRARVPACGSPATSTATRSPSAPCSASRSRVAGAPAPSPAGSTAELGKPVAQPDGGLTHLFPDAATLAALDPRTCRCRGRVAGR